MGLFDSLKKAVAGNIANELKKSIQNSAGTGSTYESSPRHSAGVNRTSPGSPGPAANDSVDIVQKFEQIFAAEFSDLELVKNASPESLGIKAPNPCKSYSYALRRNGKTAALIMLTPRNRDRNSAFLNARDSALKSNVPFLNFYTHFYNDRNYIVSRIRKAL